MQIASDYGYVLVLNQQVLTALLGVEATVIGFYGLIFVNGLASFRGTFEVLQKGEERNATKSERVKENRATISEEKYKEITKEVSEYSNAWIKAIIAANSNKTSFVNHSLVAGFSLVVSLLIAILSLAASSGRAVLCFSYFSIGVLIFVSLPQIFWAIRDLGRDAYQDWSKAVYERKANDDKI
jgi:hypothetical protein